MIVRLAAGLAATTIALAPSVQATPGDPYAPLYYFDQWHVAQLHAAGATGAGITIAEIDTGVDAAIPEFAGRVLPGKDFGPRGGDGTVDRDTDSFGHGTSMASIMVGRPGRYGIQGLAPGATLLPVAVPIDGTSDAQKDDRLPEAIRWAADHGARIISMSLGGVRRPAQNSAACPDDEQQAIFHALSKGAIVLAAGGNRGARDDAVEEPGVCLGVVAVGAVDKDGAVAPFSSRHRYLTLTAPGVDIASTGPGGAPFSGDGTSQATAVASAAAALVWSKFPTLTGTQIVARLLATLDHRSSRPDQAYGYGIVDPYQAITWDVPASAPDPVAALARPFLRQAAAHARAPAAPEPMPHAGRPPGVYSVGSAPRVLVPRVLWGVAVAAGGALLVVALAVGGLVARRRRRQDRPVLVGPTDTQWHEIRPQPR